MLGAGQKLVQAHTNVLNSDTDPDGGLDDFSSRHPGGANVVFADGSVHFIRDSIDMTTYYHLGIRNDGYALSSWE